MSSCKYMVIFDQWPYLTMPGILDQMFTDLREAIQIDRRSFKTVAKNRCYCGNIVLWNIEFSISLLVR
jgi:hypothetical protein